MDPRQSLSLSLAFSENPGRDRYLLTYLSCQSISKALTHLIRISSIGTSTMENFVWASFELQTSSYIYFSS